MQINLQRPLSLAEHEESNAAHHESGDAQREMHVEAVSAQAHGLIRKRCLLWDWTNSAGADGGVPWAMDQINFKGPISAVSNWNTWVPPELKGRASYRPMVREKAQLSGQDWANVKNANAPIVHFFNEPDGHGISAADAAALWTAQMVPLRNKKKTKLVSPSCMSNPNGAAWLADFLRRVEAHKPDFLGLHYYGTSADAAIKYLEDMHQKHPSMPVIVSEIASVSRDKKEVYAFTAKMANWMDHTSWIYEYGFFSCMRKLTDGFVSPEAQLMKPDGHFTELMEKPNKDQPVKA